MISTSSPSASQSPCDTLSELYLPHDPHDMKLTILSTNTNLNCDFFPDISIDSLADSVTIIEAEYSERYCNEITVETMFNGYYERQSAMRNGYPIYEEMFGDGIIYW